MEYRRGAESSLRFPAPHARDVQQSFRAAGTGPGDRGINYLTLRNTISTLRTCRMRHYGMCCCFVLGVYGGEEKGLGIPSIRVTTRQLMG